MNASSRRFILLPHLLLLLVAALAPACESGGYDHIFDVDNGSSAQAKPPARASSPGN